MLVLCCLLWRIYLDRRVPLPALPGSGYVRRLAGYKHRFEACAIERAEREILGEKKKTSFFLPFPSGSTGAHPWHPGCLCSTVQVRCYGVLGFFTGRSGSSQRDATKRSVWGLSMNKVGSLQSQEIG